MTPACELGRDRKAAISASSLNSKSAIRILPPNQSKPNLLCSALNCSLPIELMVSGIAVSFR